MKHKDTEKPTEKKQGFFARLIAGLDKKLEEKSKKTGCCDGSNGKGTSCC